MINGPRIKVTETLCRGEMESYFAGGVQFLGGHGACRDMVSGFSAPSVSTSGMNIRAMAPTQG